MNKEFQVHMLSEQGKEKARKIADLFDHCLDEISLICPAGRELSIVKTKLEEACFFAKKAMAQAHCEPVEQKKDYSKGIV